MKDHLPFQARWTVKVLQWLLSREVSLEEMLQDEDVLSGVVTYLTKKVAVEKDLPGQKEKEEKLGSLEKELDFVRCRLQGADQQRKNEVLDLEKRNSELREEVVKLTHKVRAAEKEIFDANFASGTTKAALKKNEEEMRDLRKKLEKTEQELAERAAELAARERELDAKVARHASMWEDEKSRLMFMLEERDNALSEAREGQAAATREIVTVSQNLEDSQERLALLEVEAVQKGVPLVKVGWEPVVGEKAAKAVAEKQRRKIDHDDDLETKAPRRKSVTPDLDPISAVVGFSQQNMFELSDDARYTEMVNLDVESIPEPNRPETPPPVRAKARSGAKPANKSAKPADKSAKPADKSAKPADKSTEPADKSTKPADKSTKPADKSAKPADKSAKPAEKSAKPAEKSAKPADKSARPADQSARPANQSAKPADKSAKPADKSARPADKSAKPADQSEKPVSGEAQRTRRSRSRRRPRRPSGGPRS